MILWMSAAMAAPPDVAALDAFYAGAIDDKGVHYDVLASRRAVLDGWLAAAKDAPVGSWLHDAQLAFWIDAYDAITVSIVLDNAPLKSIMDLDGGKIWTTRTFDVGGEHLTLDAIEGQHVRKLGDARVHAALNCASKGCPPLPRHPLTGEGLDAELTAAATAWVAGNAYAIDGSTVRLSKVFDWYGDDFVSFGKGDLANAGGHAENALWFLAKFAPADVGAKLTSGKLVPAWAEYDWSVNAAAGK